MENKICKIEDCGKPIRCKNLCKNHYERNLKYKRIEKIKFHKEPEHHKKSNTKEYLSWKNMRARCLNKNKPEYKNYGARGISVSKEWNDSFNKFFEDMGKCPEGHSLDRIDNEKGYFKENCRWASYAEQCQNKRNNKLNFEKVKKIRQSELSSIKLAKIYNVSKRTILDIKNKKIWKNVFIQKM